jgi:hypothetical protein
MWRLLSREMAERQSSDICCYVTLLSCDSLVLPVLRWGAIAVGASKQTVSGSVTS